MMKRSGVVEIQQRPSRWDALRSNKAVVHSSESSLLMPSSTDHRRQTCAAKNNHPNGFKSSFSSSCNNSSASWRRRPTLTNNSSDGNRTNKSCEENMIRKAIDNLRAAIMNENDNHNATNVLPKAIRELNIAFFGTFEHIFFESLLQEKKIDYKMPLSRVSNDMKWEATYSLLHIFSQTTKHLIMSKYYQFVICISKTASACLHLLSNGGLRPSSIRDTQICECVSILLEVLQWEDCSTTTRDSERNALLCKANLFQCIAKLIEVSKMDRREGRGPLSFWGAEKAVTLIIKENVLPFLEGLMCVTDETLSVSNKTTYSYGAIECIYLLLLGTNNEDSTMPEKLAQPRAFQASKHAAAMLAALVVDVMFDGRENQRVNPLRLRILRAVNASWSWSNERIQQNTTCPKIQTTELDSACRCLIVTFITLHALERGKVQNRQIQSDTSEINVPAIARDIKSLLEIDELVTFQPQLLHLLTSLSLAHPVSTANQWHLFLEKTDRVHSFLLSTLEKGTSALRCKEFDNSSLNLLPDALHTLSSLISSMPFKNWIGGDGGSSSKLSGGCFACRVRNAIMNILTSLMNLIAAVMGSLTEGTYRSDESFFELLMMKSALAAGKLCTVLPFHDDNSVFLAPALNLLQGSGDIFVMSARALECEKCSNTLLLIKSMVHFSHVITATSGNAPISVPVKQWLCDASSYEFIGILLQESYSAPFSFPSTKYKLETLTSIAKAAPWSISREPFNLASFREICANLCKVQNDNSYRLLGVKLIEAFILGRKAFVMENAHHNMELTNVPESFCPLLHSALKDHSSAVRTGAVTSFGSLLVTDWVVLLSRGCTIGGNLSLIDWTYVDSIIRMCTSNGETSGSVRAWACKAVGDICTVCVGSLLSEDGTEKAVPFPDDFVVAISTKVCRELEHALIDENLSVRSMALFAIGNTSLALKDRCVFLPMNRMLPLVYACIDDKDDKVVGNAIRTIGHMSYFVYTPEFLSTEGESVSDDLKLYCDLLSNLSSKIHDALCDATGCTIRELTWKQRNSAKKHAWGAATTIGMLLGHNHLLTHFDYSLVESALSQLLRCIQLYDFINEKIFAAAVTALATLPSTLWQYLSMTNDETIANGLATFFNFLDGGPSARRSSASVYRIDVERLANALILIAKKSDFCQLFLLRESLPFSIDFFYQWLISHNIQSSTIEEVVDAVTSQEMELVIDVPDIQIFLSRTAQYNQQVHDNAMQATSDEEDEL